MIWSEKERRRGKVNCFFFSATANFGLVVGGGPRFVLSFLCAASFALSLAAAFGRHTPSDPPPMVRMHQILVASLGIGSDDNGLPYRIGLGRADQKEERKEPSNERESG